MKLQSWKINANGNGHGHVECDGVRVPNVRACEVFVEVGEMTIVRLDIVAASVEIDGVYTRGFDLKRMTPTERSIHARLDMIQVALDTLMESAGVEGWSSSRLRLAASEGREPEAQSTGADP
jgi:hypothetical protein